MVDKLPAQIINQNDHLLDDVRQKLNLPTTGGQTLPVVQSLQPVLVVDPWTVPVSEQFGELYTSVAAAAGFRSEMILSAGATLAGTRDYVIEGYAKIFGAASTAYEIAFPTAGVTGFATASARVWDNRQAYRIAMPLIGTKNSAAATAATTLAIVSSALLPTFDLGPFYIDPSAPNAPLTMIIRPLADNVAINGGFKWRLLRRRT